ncbi:hypothetical protein B0T26DRAFT_735252 [Lasiosphaeria miniovina]|uniref:Rhodopsin domain-containing protein n=1 Tax=Lasiosphaeria miniovina TaxID=1954250 RepID=A0AA39ZQS3_9PEZI|nr:uncharacterized protein B0T26DRAFT_735252 [Lasiosphaeria miniovina]KAK0701922.1 hypothetical protein B0T26DRAFT_735252 [Lasiosphaeria miniovina]
MANLSSVWAGPGILPPPPGVTPNFINPPSQLQSNIALHTVCLTLVTAAVWMRMYTRLFVTNAKLGIDDIFCLLSYALTVAFSGLLIKCYTLGIGRHMWDVELRSLIPALRIFTFSQYIFLLLSLFIRLTFLFFYYRLFSAASTRYRHTLHALIAFVVALNLSIFFATLFNCNPRERNWDSTVPGECLPTSILPWFSGASASLTDIIVLAFPLPIFWTMNLAFNKKMRVIAVFSIGIFVCATSLARLGTTQILWHDPDRSWNISTIAIWATLEVNVGIICSCMLLLPAFLQRHLPKSLKLSLSRLWDYIINAIGGGSKKSHSSPGPKERHNGTWPAHVNSSQVTEHHPFTQIKPTISEQSVRAHSAQGPTEGFPVPGTAVLNHSFQFSFEENGGSDRHELPGKPWAMQN